jgi:protein PhnA
LPPKNQSKIEMSANCELCTSTENLSSYSVPPDSYADNEITVCNTCLSQIQGQQPVDSTHWSFLSDIMWNEKQAIRVMAWRMLDRMKSETWAADNLDMMYMDEETQKWAEAGNDIDAGLAPLVHKDSNGNILQDGDSVVLIKTLDVKGSSLSLKMGTMIRNIRVVKDDDGQIEGKVNGQLLVVLTKFVRKQ